MGSASAGSATPRPVWTSAVRPPARPDTSAATVRHAVQVPDARGHPAASGATRRAWWLRAPVVAAAATGGMQPTPVGASQPGGQAAAELAADVGHRRPGERAGLLEAEIVKLEPGDLAVLPAADDRLGDLLGSTATFAQVSRGQARSSHVRSATNTSSPASRSGCPVSSRYTRLPAGWGTPRCSRVLGRQSG
jgi:hypothetical protein